MHALVKGYLAALHHDGKKLLLNRHPTDPDHYGSWGPSPRHTRWDNLTDQGPTADLGSWDGRPDLPLDAEVTVLIKLMQGWTARQQGLLGLTPSDFAGQDPVRALSLRAADAIHKALYFGDDAEVGEVHVGLQFPLYYPFYGAPKVWVPEEAPQASLDLTSAFEHLPPFHQCSNARARFREFLDQLAQAGLPGPFRVPDLVRIQAELLRDFPESTYLPVTSLGFHQRFVAALFLLLSEEMRDFQFTQPSFSMPVELYLNTVTTPLERLTNRLRDTVTIRKISHELQQRFHGYFVSRYLRPLAPLAFRHPDHNPFFFYNKDAIVLLNRAADQSALEVCCREVAEATEAVITLTAIPIHGTLPLQLHGVTPPVPLRTLPLTAVDMENATADLGGELVRTFWASPAYVPVQPAGAAYHCAICNKASATPLDADELGDPCCDTCRQLRAGYRVCTQCRVFFAARSQPFCPYSTPQDRHRTQWPRTPRLLQGDGADESHRGQRVAYVLVKTNAAYRAMRAEAEALMAHFRVDRSQLEQLSGGAAQALHWSLARTRATRDGIFEYLQAAQDLHRFQNDVQDGLAEALRETEVRQQGRRLPPEHYPVRPQDYTAEALATAFLYRSPLLTLLVLPEAALQSFYPRLRARLHALQLTHSLRVVTCRHSAPVWTVLRHLGLHEEPEALRDSTQANACEALWGQQRQIDAWRTHMLGSRAVLGPLEAVRRDLQRAYDRCRDALAHTGHSLAATAIHALHIATGREFIRRGEFLACDATAIEQTIGAYQAAGGPLPSPLQQVLEGLPVLRQCQDEALAQAAQVWQSSACLEQVTAARRQQLAVGRRLTILRSGVERTFSGPLMDALLREPPSWDVSPSQLGHLADLASRLLTEVGEIPPAARDGAFRAHLLLELDARTRERRAVLIPRAVVQALRQWIMDPHLTPEAAPGFIRELALQWSQSGATRRRVPQRTR